MHFNKFEMRRKGGREYRLILYACGNVNLVVNNAVSLVVRVESRQTEHELDARYTMKVMISNWGPFIVNENRYNASIYAQKIQRKERRAT